MSRKIRATYNSDPSAGNDPATNYVIAADDANDPVGMDMDQLAAAVATRIGAAPPPLPDEDFNQLVITIQENTLTANIQSLTGLTYTHYVILSDDDTEPDYPGNAPDAFIPGSGSTIIYFR